jgi:uncharacterized protein (TIGR02646 family)
MMEIDLAKLELPDRWKERAEKAHREVEALPPDKRAKAINKRAKIWGDLKEALRKLSDGKCWYCESRETRSDNAVDHFRPKNSTSEDPDHGGYWWLAFDYENYRFTCTYCNSGRKDNATGELKGKQDLFPLLAGSTRAKCKADIADEIPCLLDPTYEGDPGLLWYDDKGQVVPTYDESKYPVHAERAKISISAYHLNHTDLVDARKMLLHYVTRKVAEGRRQFDRCATTRDACSKDALRSIIKDLHEKTSRKSPHSCAARSYIMGKYEEGNEWLKPYITHMDSNGDH